MTARKGTSRRAGAKKLKLKRDTIKDLDGKRKASHMKGGMAADTKALMCPKYTQPVTCGCRLLG